MKRATFKRIMFGLLTLMAFVARADVTDDHALIAFIQTHLDSGGQSLDDVSVELSPTHTRTRIELDAQGTLRIERSASSQYLIAIKAPGFAPTHRKVSLRVSGVVGLENDLVLVPLKRVQLSVLVGHRTTLARAKPQLVELSHDHCVTPVVSEGCSVSLCLEQEGPQLLLHTTTGSGEFFALADSGSLVQAAAEMPREATLVRRNDEHVELTVKTTWLVRGIGPAPTCAAVLRVDDIVPLR